MKNIFVFLFCTIFLTGCMSKTNIQTKNELVCIQIVDRNGMNETISAKDRLDKYENTDFLNSQPYKQVVRIYDNKSAQKSSIITTYHANGLIYQYLEIANARAFGKYRQWFQNGQQEIEANVIGGPAGVSPIEQKEWIFDKESFAWDELGHLISTYVYNKGELEGNAYYYHSNGALKRIEPYHKNEIEGVVLEYNDAGALVLKGEYTTGKRNGSFEGFWEKDIPSFTETYKQDLLLDGKYYDIAGNLLSEIKEGRGVKTIISEGEEKILVDYNNGIPEGNIVTYIKNKIHTAYKIKDGKKNGEEIEYYPDGITPKLSVSWLDDMVHGTVRTWYSNSIIQSQREMYENKKNGTLTAWYQNGNLMMIEEYENDHLIKGSYFKNADSFPISTILNGNGKATLHDENGNFLKTIIYQNGYPQVE